MKVEWRGRQVPWITRWTDEVIPPQLINLRMVPTEGDDWRIGCKGEEDSDFLDGVMWLPENDAQGVGTPMWKDVQSHRQRRCHLEGRCQVCGEVIDPPVFYLIPAPLYAQKSGSSLVTDVAPVCRADVDVAREYCPELRKQDRRTVLYEVRGMRPTAIFGDIMEATKQGPRLRQGEVDMGNRSGLTKVMARQLVVELYDFRRRQL